MLKQALLKNAKLESDFPIKFSKKSGTSSAAYSIGMSKANAGYISELKFPKRRTISKVVVHRIDEGHWHLVFTANKVATNKESAPEVKLIKIDLTQASYRIIYNADPENTLLQTTYEFAGTKPTAEDIYRIVVDVAKAKGKWTEGYNCQSFVNEVIERLGTLPSVSLKKI